MRRLDALVAERIEGLTLCSDEYHECPTGRGVRIRNAPYSTDMNAALEAAERFKGPPTDYEFTWAIELAWVEDAPERTGWLATVRRHESDFHDHPATALCIALLRAAGVDEDEIAEAMGDSDG